MQWGRKSKVVISVAVVLSRTEELHHAFETNREGYRSELRLILQSCQVLVDEINEDPTVRSEFFAKVREFRQDRKFGLPNLTLEVVTQVTGDSRKSRQRASKYARVLTILRSEGVPTDHIATTIKTRGGIERILRDESRNEEQMNSDEPAVSPAQHATDSRNDQEVLCGIYMRMSDLDAISEQGIGASIVIDALRIGQPKAELKLQRLRFRASPLDDDGDDED